jgi:hypothetical protein
MTESFGVNLFGVFMNVRGRSVYMSEGLVDVHLSGRLIRRIPIGGMLILWIILLFQASFYMDPLLSA